MGWTSTGDALENNARYLHFPSRESAVAFAEKNNWPYEVEEPNPVSTARPLRYQGCESKITNGFLERIGSVSTALSNPPPLPPHRRRRQL